jgi:hypothetical protein
VLPELLVVIADEVKHKEAIRNLHLLPQMSMVM